MRDRRNKNHEKNKKLVRRSHEEPTNCRIEQCMKNEKRCREKNGCRGAKNESEGVRLINPLNAIGNFSCQKDTTRKILIALQ